MSTKTKSKRYRFTNNSDLPDPVPVPWGDRFAPFPYKTVFRVPDPVNGDEATKRVVVEAAGRHGEVTIDSCSMTTSAVQAHRERHGWEVLGRIDGEAGEIRWYEGPPK